MPPDAVVSIEARLGPYELDRLLGSGGMADVWHAVHVEHEVEVAVKVMHSSYLRDVALEQFRREVEAVAALDHPGIIRVLDFGHVPASTAEAAGPRIPAEAPYLVCEYADGPTLAKRMAADDLDWEEVRGMLLAVLDGLAHAHARGVIHRDLKPDNILSFSDGTWRLVDFGIAAVDQGYDDREANPSGTPRYMSPEQFRGYYRELGPWSDLYSLGCVAYQAVTGVTPFDGQSSFELMRQHLTEPAPPIASRLAIPHPLRAWIGRLLRKSPMSRYQRAADAAWALRQMGEATPQSGPRAPVPPPKVTHTSSDPTLKTPGLGNTVQLGSAAERETARYEAARPEERPPMPGDWRAADQRPRSVLDGASPRLFGLRATPVIGREDERDLLWAGLRTAAHGGEAMVLLQGPSGSGKSRLAEWLRVRGHELGIATPLHAGAGQEASSSHAPAAVIARHFVLLGLSAPELAERLDELHAEVGIEPRSAILVIEAVRRMAEDSGEPPRGWLDAASNMLKAAAVARPVILSIEDLHRAPLWLDFLSAARELPGVLVVATVNSESVAREPQTKAALDHLTEVRRAKVAHLEPLGDRDGIALVRGLLRLEPALATRVARRSGGNPLFATHLVADWIAHNWLVARADGWHLREGVEPRFPDDLHEIWRDHLQHILAQRPPSDAHALEVAAVLGSRVAAEEWSAALAAMNLPSAEGLVEALVLAGLAIREDGNDWRFVHGMLRESVLRSSREGGRYPELHRLAAQVLQARAATHGGVARVAVHLYEAELYEEAVRPLYDGARALLDGGDHAGAVDLLEKRLTAIDRAREAGADVEPAQRWKGELLRALALHRARRLQAAWDLAQHVLDMAGALRSKPLLADAYALLARLSGVRGDQRHTRRFAEHALELYRQLDDQRGIADAHLRLGDYFAYVGDFASARENYHAAAAAAKAASDGAGENRFAVAWAAWGLGFVQYQLGNLDDARAQLMHGVDVFRAAGDEYYAQNVVVSLADVERVQGNFEEAERLYEGAYRFLNFLGETPASVYLNRALLDLMRGRFDVARRHVEDAKRSLANDPVHGSRLAVFALDASFAARDEDEERWLELVTTLAEEIDRVNVLEFDSVWALEQAVREAAGRFDPSHVARAAEMTAGYWRRLSREPEAISLEALARDLREE